MKKGVKQSIDGLEKFIMKGPLGPNTIPGNAPEGRETREVALSCLIILKLEIEKLEKTIIKLRGDRSLPMQTRKRG